MIRADHETVGSAVGQQNCLASRTMVVAGPRRTRQRSWFPRSTRRPGLRSAQPRHFENQVRGRVYSCPYTAIDYGVLGSGMVLRSGEWQEVAISSIRVGHRAKQSWGSRASVVKTLCYLLNAAAQHPLVASLTHARGLAFPKMKCMAAAWNQKQALPSGADLTGTDLQLLEDSQ